MSDYHINVFYSDEDVGYIADVPDLEACSAFGSTAEEALAEVERAKEAWLAAAREAGRPIQSHATVRRSTRGSVGCDISDQGRLGDRVPRITIGTAPLERGHLFAEAIAVGLANHACIDPERRHRISWPTWAWT
jgi:predicted RNase H-like HicB family nuclease